MTVTEESLPSVCESFVRSRRNLDGCGHERRHMFNSTCPFVDTEGLRYTSSTNNSFDYVKYQPSAAHLFLSEPSLNAFSRYLDGMFDPRDDNSDWCYFKILKKLLPRDFGNLVEIVKRGTFLNKSAPEGYRLPLCLIPVIEFQLIEDHSDAYSVKFSNASLQRILCRQKLNTYFRALLTLLDCSEDQLLKVMVSKGVLPSMDFRLLSTQKELTIALARYRRSGDIHDRLVEALHSAESTHGMLKPAYGSPNTNLLQSLVDIFARHPVYVAARDSLLLETYFFDGERKSRLSNTRPIRRPKKRQRKGRNDILAEAMSRTIPELMCCASIKFRG